MVFYVRRRASPEPFGSFVCADRQTGEVREHGTYRDRQFATFTSPRDANHFNGYYYDNITCSYTFHAQPGMHVYVEFVYLQLARDDCQGDFVTLQLGPNAQRKICGEPQGSVYDIYEKTEASLSFVSDDQSANLGFSGYFLAYDPGKRNG